MFVTAGLVLDDNFTGEEVAGILLHELGHVFTYFEYLGTNITTNYVLQHVSRELTGTRELKRKYEVIKDAEEALGIKIEDTDSIVRTEKEEVITTVILREVVKERYSELGSKTYDMTAYEMLSDQFATRHGAGRSLVTALDKMYRKYGAAEFKSTKGYLIAEAFKFLLFIIGSVVTLGIVAVLVLFVIDPTENIYDKPKSRIQRVRLDMVDAIKNTSVDKDYRKKLVADIEAIDLILKEMEERRTLIEMFWITVNPRTRKNYQQQRFQQELEMLVNNDIFVKAAKLKTLNA